MVTDWCPETAGGDYDCGWHLRFGLLHIERTVSSRRIRICSAVTKRVRMRRPLPAMTR
jgi:hypothetical protein